MVLFLFRDNSPSRFPGDTFTIFLLSYPYKTL